MELITFSIGAVLLIFGIGLFNLGADLAMTPMGSQMGAGLSRQRKLGLLLAVCFVMGMLITIAEPDLQVLAKQVGVVMNGTLLIYCVGIGVGAFLVLSVLKMGGDALLEIAFDQIGTKKLMAKTASAHMKKL